MSSVDFLDQLLDGAEVEWKALGDVINFQRGKRLVRSQLEESGAYAVYQNSMTPLGYYHESNVHAKSALLFVRVLLERLVLAKVSSGQLMMFILLRYQRP